METIEKFSIPVPERPKKFDPDRFQDNVRIMRNLGLERDEMLGYLWRMTVTAVKRAIVDACPSVKHAIEHQMSDRVLIETLVLEPGDAETKLSDAIQRFAERVHRMTTDGILVGSAEADIEVVDGQGRVSITLRQRVRPIRP